MARVLCISCGLRSRHCQCHQQLPTTGNANGDDGDRAFKLTPASFCVCYLISVLPIFGFSLILSWTLISLNPQNTCYLEVFVDSLSVSNASTANANANATADWNVRFVVKNRPGNGCKASLHTIKSSLLRGDKLISESSTPDYFGKLVTGKINEPLSYAVFKTVSTPEGIGGVVWDLRVEVVSSVQVNDGSDIEDGFFFVKCGDITVNFTVDPAGHVKGSLLGYMRPCEYLFRKNYTDTSF